MEDLGIKLNPLSKLTLYRKAGKYISEIIHKRIIDPKRASVMVDYLKKHVINVETPKMAKEFYLHLAYKFPELQGLKAKIEMEESEKIEKVFAILLEHIVEKGDFELASNVMDEVQEMSDKGKIEKLKSQFPEEFEKAVEKVALG